MKRKEIKLTFLNQYLKDSIETIQEEFETSKKEKVALEKGNEEL